MAAHARPCLEAAEVIRERQVRRSSDAPNAVRSKAKTAYKNGGLRLGSRFVDLEVTAAVAVQVRCGTS